MAQLHSELADFRTYAATRTWQLLMAAAVTSFVICHVIALRTVPQGYGFSHSADSVLERHLLHFTAVLLRFALPYAFLAWGFGAYWRFRRRVH